MSKQNFNPFETNIARETALKYLKQATDGAEDGELFLENRRSESLVFDDGRLKTANYDAAQGFGLRAVQGDVTGYAHSTEISEAALKRATKTAQLATKQGGGLWGEAPKPGANNLYFQGDPIAPVPFARKLETLRAIDDFARSLDKRVVQVTASISASVQEILILRPEDEAIRDTRPMTRLNVSVIVEHEGRRESGSAGGGGRIALDGLLEPQDWQSKTREAVRVALVNLEAIPAPAGVMDVVLGPGWPGILLHEAIGHGLEGDFNRKGASAFSGLMGQRIAAKGVTVLDDGTVKNARGSINFDDEGTPAAANTLIEDGILTGYMQDRQNARLSGNAATGNGRRESFAHAPMPRMTNTYMLNGDTDPKDIIRDLKDGIYAVGFGGGQVDITNGKFVFSCTEAYHVRNGNIGPALNGATLIGDGATALKHIQAIGNDMQLDPGMGNCGKAGQWVPVGVGQPSLMISGLTIGGSAA